MSTAADESRFDRQSSEDHLLRLLEDGFLNMKSPYNKFQTFLDLKDDATFTGFRRKLENFIEQQKYKWSELEDADPKRRNDCARRFLARFGDEYWGADPENRKKYLASRGESEDKDENCKWPEDSKPLTEAVAILLGKISRGKIKRDSSSQGAKTATAPVPATTTTTTTNTSATQHNLTFDKPRTIATSHFTPPAERHQRAQSADPTTPGVIKRDVSTSPQQVRRVPEERRDHAKKDTSANRKLVPQGPMFNSFPVNPSTSARSKAIRKPVKICLPENPGAHEARTYFLVLEQGSATKARSIAWQMFRSSSEMIDRMISDLATEEDDSARQLQREIYISRYTHAEISLGWSDLTFVIRRGYDLDLQELVRHVGCAWHADDAGKISVPEFRIEVSLKE